MPRTDEALALLGHTRLFHGLDAATLAPLLKDHRWFRFPKGSFIFREGDPGDRLLIVASGQVKVSRQTEGGEEVVFRVLRPGDSLGEFAALDHDAVRSADAAATTQTECLVIPGSSLVPFLRSNPTAMWNVITSLISLVKARDEDVLDLAVLDIAGRVAHKLVDMASAEAADANPARQATLSISQSTLASSVGASRENVNRALKRFASLGLITVERGRITILKPHELRRAR
jgi:CRP/FNR family cyclic AMP-dependent transcriptional regulator